MPEWNSWAWLPEKLNWKAKFLPSKEWSWDSLMRSQISELKSQLCRAQSNLSQTSLLHWAKVIIWCLKRPMTQLSNWASASMLTLHQSMLMILPITKSSLRTNADNFFTQFSPWANKLLTTEINSKIFLETSTWLVKLSCNTTLNFNNTVTQTKVSGRPLTILWTKSSKLKQKFSNNFNSPTTSPIPVTIISQHPLIVLHMPTMSNGNQSQLNMTRVSCSSPTFGSACTNFKWPEMKFSSEPTVKVILKWSLQSMPLYKT